jgi:hypothetical protein
MVVNWGWEWVLRLRNDLAQQARPSIYRANGRWPRIWGRTRGGRRNKSSLAQVLRVRSPWLSLQRWTEGYSGSRRSGGGARVRGVKPCDGCHRRAIRVSRKAQEKRWWVTGVIPRTWLLPSGLIGSSATRILQRWRESRRGSSAVRFLALAVWSSSGTVPWRARFSYPDRATSGQFFSNFCITTSSSLCTKVADQCSSYNVSITTIAKFLLNHVQICAQSSCSAVSVWKFRLKMTWQPDFECDYLQILHNNLAYTLKQNCSPLFALQLWCGALGQKP